MNPIRGIVHGSPFKGQVHVSGAVDEIDKQLEIGNSEWQKKATSYVKECITRETQYTMKKFTDDQMLNKIRLDKTLFHIPKSHGSYIDSRTGRLTSSGKKAKEKLYPNQAQVHESEGSVELVPKKIRKSAQVYCMLWHC
jgi:hypothetical protein